MAKASLIAQSKQKMIIMLYLATDNALAVLTINEDHCQCELQLANRNSRCVAVDPLRPELVYCGTFGDGVYRSDDNGRNWQPAHRGITHMKVSSVAVSRIERVNERGVVYAGTEPSAVFRSEDGGESWRECIGLTRLPSSSEWSFPPRPHTHHARWIQPDQHTKDRLFVAIEAGALIGSPDSGDSWTDRVPTSPIDTHQLAQHPSEPDRLYSGAGDGYFESSDAGDTWVKLEEGLEHRYAWSVAVDPGDADTRLISSAASPRASHHKDEAESFIYRRTAHTSWQQVSDGLPDPTGRRTAVLSSHPSRPGIFFAAWESDVFRSTDGGVCWQPLEIPWPKGFHVGEPRGLIVAESV